MEGKALTERSVNIRIEGCAKPPGLLGLDACRGCHNRLLPCLSKQQQADIGAGEGCGLFDHPAQHLAAIQGFRDGLLDRH
jgi:hypothetical protein